MSTYDLQQMIKLWAQEKLTLEQAIGQILLHIHDLSQRVKTLENQSEQERRLSENDSHTGG